LRVSSKSNGNHYINVLKNEQIEESPYVSLDSYTANPIVDVSYYSRYYRPCYTWSPNFPKYYELGDSAYFSDLYGTPECP
jgi:hypothetical protein